MEIILLILSCIIFFTYSSMVTSRYIAVISSLSMTRNEIILITILCHLGSIVAVMIYDVAKRVNIIKFFISCSIIFAALQIALQYTHGNLALIGTISIVLYCCYNVIDLCSSIIGKYVPFMLGVFLRNLGSLMASAIHTRIDYINSVQSRNLVLYLASSSVIAMLGTNINIKFKSDTSVISISDIWVLYNEYSGLFWSFIFVNLLDIILTKYLAYMLAILNSNNQYISMLEFTFYLGRIILHYPFMMLLTKYKSLLRILIPQVLNLICIVLVPILFVYDYKIGCYIIIFLVGCFSLLRHGISMQFNESLQEEHKHIQLDTALNKMRSICVLLSFLLELTLIAQWHVGAYIIIILFQIASVISLIFYRH